MKQKQQGFTIIELLIATTVFSVVMVICLASFLRVGQLYYKGIYLARTQEATRNIADDIANQLRLNGSINPSLQKAGSQIGLHDVYYMCAGSKRYSFMSNNVVNTQTESTTNFGLVRDDLTAADCKSPTVVGLNNPTELLGDNMRMVADSTGSDLRITCTTISSNKICAVHVHVDFGSDDLLVNPDPAHNDSFAAGPAVPGGACSGPLQGSQFCATSDLDTTIYPLQ